MVQNLLAVAAFLGAGVAIVALWRRGRSSPEYVSLAEAATAVWDERVDHGTAATLEVRVEQDVAVYADPRELSGLLTALLENAVDHGPAEGTVRLERTDTGFAVADDGPGIPDTEREQVFEFGYSTSPGHDGLGLGLVYSVCESHDWDVEITDSESGGARVVVSGVEFSTNWGEESTSSDGDTGTPDWADDQESAGDSSYIRDVADEETTEDEWVSPDS